MSEGDEPAADALRWLRFARADLGTARRLLGDTAVPPHHACLHSQQAAEKALKALLRADGIPFPPIHDLEYLVDLLPASRALPASRPHLDRLTDWHIEARYPGPWAEPTAADAEQAATTAAAVNEYVVGEFERRGIAVE